MTDTTSNTRPVRVAIPAHLDVWMRGDRFGTLVRVTRSHVHVRLDRSGRVIRLSHQVWDAYGETLS